MLHISFNWSLGLGVFTTIFTKYCEFLWDKQLLPKNTDWGSFNMDSINNDLVQLIGNIECIWWFSIACHVCTCCAGWQTSSKETWLTWNSSNVTGLFIPDLNLWKLLFRNWKKTLNIVMPHCDPHYDNTQMSECSLLHGDCWSWLDGENLYGIFTPSAWL